MVELKQNGIYFNPMRVGTSTFGRVCQITRIEGEQVSVCYIADRYESTMSRTAAGNFEPYDKGKVEADRDALRTILSNFETFLQQ